MENISIAKRGLNALNLEQYGHTNAPELVGRIQPNLPKGRQYVLRCLIKTAFDDYKVPDFLQWANPLIAMAHDYQFNILKLRQPFCYITVRSGPVESVTDDEWHVDGFSQTITHLPEQNYVWIDSIPTEYVIKPFIFPADFDSSKHNIQMFFQDRINKKDKVHAIDTNTLYCMDPYVIHRRPKKSKGKFRTFVRISYTPIEISDCNNTINPLLETNYTRDGVKTFRESLIRYL